MKRKVGLLLLSTSVLTGCVLNLPTTSQTTSSSSSEQESISESYSVSDYADEITINKLEFTDFDGNIRVFYDNSINPFAYTGHKFSYLLINKSPAENLIYSEFYNSKGYFYASIDKNVKAKYLVEWYDTKDRCYLFGETDQVYQPEVPPELPPDDDVNYPEGYSSLIFQDEFAGTSVDDSKWDYDLGNGSNGWGNGEGEYYTKENATVNNGFLHITMKKEQVSSFNYTSSRMVTRGKFSFKYGYIEARISLPEVIGMWPAFWMMPEESVYGGWPKSGEIDIMEAKGRYPKLSSSALHFTTKEGGHTYRTNEQSFLSGTLSDFHTYACKWEKESISFYVDGREHLKVNYDTWQTSTALNNDYAPFDQNFHLILNLAVGGHFDGYSYPPEPFTSCDMLVDYVRIFQK